MNLQRVSLLIILLGLLATSFLFDNNRLLSPGFLTKLTQAEEKRKKNKPEFQIKNFTTKHFDKHGKLESILEAEKFVSYESKEESLVFEPTIHMFSGNEESNWVIESKVAKSTHPNTEIQLEKEVVMTKLPSATDEITAIVYADEMKVSTKDKTANTSGPVKIISDSSEITGKGMEAFLEQERLDILANINSKYLNKGEKDENGKEIYTYINSDAFSFNHKKNIASYKNNVDLAYKNISITAEQIDIVRDDSSHTAYAYGKPSTFKQDSAKDKKIIRASANRFEFNNREQILKMFEEAKLDQNGAIVEGDYLYYNTQSETIGAESKKDSRVKMVLPVKSDPKK